MPRKVFLLTHEFDALKKMIEGAIFDNAYNQGYDLEINEKKNPGIDDAIMELFYRGTNRVPEGRL